MRGMHSILSGRVTHLLMNQVNTLGLDHGPISLDNRLYMVFTTPSLAYGADIMLAIMGVYREGIELNRI